MKYMADDKDQIMYFARTNFRNQNQRFGIQKPDRRYHMYIIGKTGMGKTTLMERMIVSDLTSNNGLAVFDPHGDLAVRVLNHLPKRRKNDLIYLDPSDQKHALSLNLLKCSDPNKKHLICSGVISIFKKLFGEFWGPRTEHVLRNAVLTLLGCPGATLLDIPHLLTDEAYRNRLVGKIRDPVLLSFWNDEFGKYQQKFRQEVISPILNKIGQFAANPIVRNIVGQPKDRINVSKIMDRSRILIVNLAKGQIGEDAVSLLGACLITKFQLAALERASVPYDQRRDFYLYVDEFHEFATESFISILPEVRKYKLCLILAHQYLDQLPEEMRKAVMGNAGSLIAFRVGSHDAKILEQEFYPRFSQEDFVRLPQFQIYLKLMINGVVSEGFSARINDY